MGLATIQGSILRKLLNHLDNMDITGQGKVEATLGEGDLAIDVWGTPKVSQPFSIFHGMWTFDLVPKMWFTYENGTQVYSPTAISSTGGMAKLLTDTPVTSAVLEWGEQI